MIAEVQGCLHTGYRSVRLDIQFRVFAELRSKISKLMQYDLDILQKRRVQSSINPIHLSNK